ncbi:hypothetical protein E2986_12068 [Frieseomelitta varia]|uniref:Uncharacterized protein n=1 Tax=Frieseomelitta varia TaxID=561572 RepID=A0A833SNP4_9HYME|nr:hypothetical protein E2986_12068 [Frieseomelitta varia]
MNIVIKSVKFAITNQRMIGGSSTSNFMLYVRGSLRTIEEATMNGQKKEASWLKLQRSYLLYFLKSESNRNPEVSTKFNTISQNLVSISLNSKSYPVVSISVKRNFQDHVTTNGLIIATYFTSESISRKKEDIFYCKKTHRRPSSAINTTSVSVFLQYSSTKMACLIISGDFTNK